METNLQYLLERGLQVETNYLSNAPHVFKDIEGFPLYEVSEFGEVRNKKTKQILKNRENGNGYLRVDLRKDGKAYKRYVHRLVAETFLENFAGFEHVNHKDEIKTNNHVSNLEWVSARYNMQYSRAVVLVAKRDHLKGYEPYYIEFNSFSEARYAGFNTLSVKKAIKEGKPYKGYFFSIKGTKADIYKEETKQ